MTNWEKYKDKIIKLAKETNKIYLVCDEFCKKILEKEFELSCEECRCTTCGLLISSWLQEEYQEPEVDWSKVEVDTPVLVSDDGENYLKGCFAQYESGRVFTWANGKTSWTADGDCDICGWLYAKLGK